MSAPSHLRDEWVRRRIAAHPGERASTLAQLCALPVWAAKDALSRLLARGEVRYEVEHWAQHDGRAGRRARLWFVVAHNETRGRAT